MKALSLLPLGLILFSPLAFSSSNGGRGGGDTINAPFASVAQIQNAVSEAPFYLRAWIQGVQTQMRPDHGLSGRPRRKLPLPKGVEKLFKNGVQNASYQLESLQVTFKIASPCASADNQDHDGSVISEPDHAICISGFNLSQKLKTTDYAIQTEALMMHELSHLLGADEEEATSIQAQYLADMGAVPKEVIMAELERTSETLHGLAVVKIREMRGQLDDTEKLCASILKARSALGEGSRNSVLSSISIFTAEQRDQLNDMQVVLGQVWHLYVCGQDPKRPVPSWTKSYNDGFGAKEKVTLPEWILGAHGTKVPKTTSYRSLNRLHSVQDLDEPLISFASELVDLAWNIPFRFMIKSSITIDNAK